MVTTTDDDEKKWSGVKSGVRLDEGGSYKGSLRLWMRDGESWYPTLRKTIWILEQLRDFVQVCFSYFCSFFLMNSLYPYKILRYSKISHKKRFSYVINRL